MAVQQTVIDLTEDSPSPAPPAKPEPHKSERQDPPADLLNAINDASSQRVKAVLIEVLTANPGAFGTARTMLAETEIKSVEVDKNLDMEKAQEERTDEKAGKNLAAREKPEVAVCENCDNEFDVEESKLPPPPGTDWDDDSICFYHPGECRVDWESDVWYDWDEDCNGPMDTPEHRFEWPQGFVFTCCERDGDDPCKRARHVAKESRAKKQKIY
ncbi:hypothetical protein T439DRAFT_377602 [Meredithblackwellia eburnea MCA 4105]